MGVTREKRIQYAQELLEKNFLPHVSISPGCQTAKVRAPLPARFSIGVPCKGP